MEALASPFKRTFSYAIIIFVMVFAFAGSSGNLLAEEAAPQPAAAGITDDDGLSGIDALFARAARYGSVRVIVGFEVGFQPEGALLSEAQVENQRLSIDLSQDVVLNSLASHDVRDVKRFDYIPYMAMEVDEAGLDALWSNPDIVSIHEDKPLPPTLYDSVPLISADDVWNIEGFDGSGIAVAILDTGVKSNHEFLDDGKVVSEACYSTTDSSYGSKTVCPNGNQSQTGTGAGKNCSTSWDGCLHGTHVAGIAAGTAGISNLEGVAKGADIIAVQVFSKFTGSYYCGSQSPCVLSWQSDQIKGLERVYALRNKFNIAAVNMSLGGGGPYNSCNDEPQAAIIKTLRSAGIATVISSGNNGFTTGLSSPACISAAVSVGATTKADSVASFSNHSSTLDLLAPGVSIYSSVATSNSSYDTYQGTSMAAPHVAGAFALLRQANFGASVNQIEQALKSNPGAMISKYGSNPKPRIDVSLALAALGEMRPEITAPGMGDTIDTSSVDFQWTANGAGVQLWDLWLGSAPGKADVYDGPSMDPDVLNKTIDCLPVTGDPLYARLRFKIRQTWWHIDFQYATATPANAPEITLPSPGATLTDNQVTFSWDPGDVCVDAWKFYVGTSVGANNLYNSGKLPGTDSGHTVNGLPFDASTLYVRLRYQVAGIWQYIDVTYTAPSWTIGITSPTPGTQLASNEVTFNWTPDPTPAGVLSKWRLYVGSEMGRDNYFNSGNLTPDATSAMVQGLPVNGRTIYVRLMFKLNGIWEYEDYQYTAVDTLPQITAPVPGTVLSGYDVTFEWTPQSHTVERWRLYIGSAKGLDDYHNSGGLLSAARSERCQVVPTDGSTVYVRLMYKKAGVWKYRDYTYTAKDILPTITRPTTNGSEIQTTSYLFEWQANGGYVRYYKLRIGSTSGGSDIYDSGRLPGTDTSHMVNHLPFDGSTIYVRLMYKSGVVWKSVYYSYTVKDTAPYMVSPSNNSTFTSSRATFQWATRGAVVQYYRVYVSRTQGNNDKYDSGKLPGSTLSCEARQLPINGKKLYVRLRYMVDGLWYYRDYTYYAVTWNTFKIDDPKPKSTLSGSSETFYWGAYGAPVHQWKLKIGTKAGSGNEYNSGWLLSGTTNAYVTGLPTNGQKLYARLEVRFDYGDDGYDNYYKDYWYKAQSTRSYHRLYNGFVCPFDNSKPAIALSACGVELSAGYNKWSSCKSVDSTYCDIYGSIKSGQCKDSGYLDSINFTAGCVYSYNVYESGYIVYIDIYQQCPGTCSTAKPFFDSGSLSDLDTAGELIKTIKITPDGNTESDQ